VKRTAALAAGALTVAALTSGCQAAGGTGDGLTVVASTEIIADLVRQVGGSRVRADTVVPPGGDPHSYEPTPTDAVKVSHADVAFTNHAVTDVTGPGRFVLYLTDALGQPDVYANSADGLDADDVTVLPPNAHTHLNWAFGAPGVYKVTFSATVDAGDGAAPKPLGTGTFAFAVGVDPATVGPPVVLERGHADIAVDLDTGQVFARTDDRGDLAAADLVIDVPDRAVERVPDDQRFAFVGAPGAAVHQLPQAVLGKHVHGEIDPHLWEDVRNVKAYVQVIADTLISKDPGGRDGYERNRDAYLAKLDELHAYVGTQIDRIPEADRQLVTTHDAFGYLAKAYGMRVAGFVVPNPAQEPSAAQVTALTKVISDLRVRAVFVEPNLAARADVLRRVAADQNVQVCRIYGDAFDREIDNYLSMMRHNADELLRCLGKDQ
jgi:anchored repeat ABC transporter substrate-binding protein